MQYSKRWLPRGSAVGVCAILCVASVSALRAFLSADSAPPSDPVARLVSPTEVAVSFNPSGPGFRYRVMRSIDGGRAVYQRADIPPSDHRITYVDHLLQPGTKYTYQIINVPPDFTYYSASSTIVNVTTPQWAEYDIGNVGATGSSARIADTYLIGGSGADLWGSADAFHFSAQPWTGDGVVVARVTAMDNTAQWAKAGIMVRESLSPGSRYVMAAMNPHGDSALLARTTTNGESQFGISVYTYVPTWLKLVRAGSRFDAFQSRDGSEWIPIGSTTVDMPATAFVGLAVTSHNEGTLCRAVFDNVNVSPTWNPGATAGPATHVQAQAVLPGAIRLTWTTPPNRTDLFIEQSEDNVHFEAAQPDTTGTVRALVAGTTNYFRVRAFDGSPGFFSETVSATTPPAPADQVPAAPTNFVAKPSSSTITLTWQDVATNEDDYWIDFTTDGVFWSERQERGANATQTIVGGLQGGTAYTFRVRAVRWGADDTGRARICSPAVIVQAVTTGLSSSLTPTGGPTITQQPQSQVAVAGQPVQFTVAAASSAPTYQWRRDGADRGTQASVTVQSSYLGDLGLYSVWIADAGGVSVSKPAILGFTSTVKTAQGQEIGTDIKHPNGNVYDQVAMPYVPADSITADPGQVTRTSFVDVNGDIVQIEFSGAGTLSLRFDDNPYQGSAQKYNQSNTKYWIGRPGIVISGADETTNVGVFSVGRATAVNQSLFSDNVEYDGVADIEYIAILSRNGQFGGVYTGNARYSSSHGNVGIYAPGVSFASRVAVGDVHATDDAQSVLVIGGVSDAVRVTGGNLAQVNGRPVIVSGISQLRFEAGSDSHGHALPAQANQARLEQDGRDVTTQVVSGP